MVTCLPRVSNDYKHNKHNQRFVIQANYFNVKTALQSIPPSALCPPGEYMHVRGRGSAAAQPQCKPCAPGFFKSATSSTINSCTAHTKCPPGKHTIASGSTTSQPKCETCATGFYKAITSKSSTCVGTPGRSGPFYAQTSLHCVVGTCNRLHNSYCFFH